MRGYRVETFERVMAGIEVIMEVVKFEGIEDIGFPPWAETGLLAVEDAAVRFTGG